MDADSVEQFGDIRLAGNSRSQTPERVDDLHLVVRTSRMARAYRRWESGRRHSGQDRPQRLRDRDRRRGLHEVEKELQTETRKQGVAPSRTAKPRNGGFAATRAERVALRPDILGSKTGHGWLCKWRQVALSEHNNHNAPGSFRWLRKDSVVSTRSCVAWTFSALFSSIRLVWILVGVVRDDIRLARCRKNRFPMKASIVRRKIKMLFC